MIQLKRRQATMNVDVASFATVPLPGDFEALIVSPAGPRERFTDDEFAEFCSAHPELRVEMNSEGEMIIMPLLSLKVVGVTLPSRYDLANGSKPTALA